MKIKTSELTSAALDWAVAKCKGALAPLGNVMVHEPDGVLLIAVGSDMFHNDERVHYSPSTDWAQGGPIIEREGIDLYCNVPSGVADKFTDWKTSWRARYSRCGFGTEMMHGPTPLLAAMRCYVASKLGDEIEVPNELCD